MGQRRRGLQRHRLCGKFRPHHGNCMSVSASVTLSSFQDQQCCEVLIAFNRAHKHFACLNCRSSTVTAHMKRFSTLYNICAGKWRWRRHHPAVGAGGRGGGPAVAARARRLAGARLRQCAGRRAQRALRAGGHGSGAAPGPLVSRHARPKRSLAARLAAGWLRLRP